MLFRPEVAQARRRKLFGAVRLSQPPSLLAWTIAGSAVAILATGGLLFGAFPRKERVPGYIVPRSGVVQVAASRPGRVTMVPVQEGQHVRAGDVLIRLSGETAGAENPGVLTTQLEELDREAAAATQRATAAITGVSGERARVLGQIERQKTGVSLLMRRLDAQRLNVSIAKDQLARYEALAAKGYASQVQVNQLRQQLISATDAVLGLEQEINTQSALADDLRGQVAVLSDKQAEADAVLRTEQSQLRQKRLDLATARTFVEQSPIAGVVANVQAVPGMTPSAGAPLVWVTPDNSELEAELLAPSRAIGFIRSGEPVRLRIDAFPYQRFGYIRGRVRSVSATVVEPAGIIGPLVPKEAVYRVRVALDGASITAYGRQHRLMPGMQLVAEILIERRNLLQRIADPLAGSGGW